MKTVCFILLLLCSLVFGSLPNPFTPRRLSVRLGNDGVNPRYFISDDLGREVFFKGTNLEAEQRELAPYIRSTNIQDYSNGQCVANNPNYSEPPICGVDAGKGMFNMSDSYQTNNDFAQIRRLGFNMVRLCLSWSELEPSAGNYSTSYIDRIEQIVGWALEQGVYVLLDLHEDLYSRYIFGDTQHQLPPILVASDGQDGAPQWAVQTDGWPALAVFGTGNLNLAMMKAYSHFWDNDVLSNVPQGQAPGPGLQDHFIGAVAALARRFVDKRDEYPNILGIELQNEPQMGLHIIPNNFASEYLYPFYTRTIQAITGIRDGLPSCPKENPFSKNISCAYTDLGVHTDALIFVEPNALRNLLDFSPQVSVPFTTYQNIVFAPHVYTHEFTVDQSIFKWNKTTSPYPPSYDFAYQTGRAEALKMKCAIFVTEFGCGTGDDDLVLQNTIKSQEKYLTPSSQWSWKSNCGGQPCEWAWTVMNPAVFVNGTYLPSSQDAFPSRVKYLSRIYPRAVAGYLNHNLYDHDTNSYILVANHTDPSKDNSTIEESHLTLIYIPGPVMDKMGPSGYSVKVSGSAGFVESEAFPDGSHFIFIQTFGLGEYEVQIIPNQFTSNQKEIISLQLTKSISLEQSNRLNELSNNIGLLSEDEQNNHPMLKLILESFQKAVQMGEDWIKKSGQSTAQY